MHDSAVSSPKYTNIISLIPSQMDNYHCYQGLHKCISGVDPPHSSLRTTLFEIPKITFSIDLYNTLRTSKRGQPLYKDKQLNLYYCPKCVSYSDVPLY